MENFVKNLNRIYQRILKPLISFFFGIYFGLWSRLKPERANNPILFISAKELSKKIREKKVSYSIYYQI